MTFRVPTNQKLKSFPFSVFRFPLLFVVVSVVLAVVAVASVASTQQVQRCNNATPTAYQISDYDMMFREVGGTYGVDWRLLSAIACVESEFRFDAVSRVGAVGLMQIMPYVAQRMGYAREELFDARISAIVAAKLLKENEKMLHLSKKVDAEEHLRFVLACYNAGYSRINDARRLARFYEDDANRWSCVSHYLSMLDEQEYFEHEVVESGAFYGSDETIAYVAAVIHHYNNYRRRVFL